MARSITYFLGGLAALWVLGSPIHYLLTLDISRVHAIAYWLRDQGDVWLLALLPIQFAIVPLLLLLGLREVRATSMPRVVFGAIAGAVLGMWSSSTFLVIPILGIYASFPTVCLAFAVARGPGAGPLYYLTVLGVNTVLYPVIGAVVASRNRPPNCRRPCKQCSYELWGNVSGRCPECGHEIGHAHGSGSVQCGDYPDN